PCEEPLPRPRISQRALLPTRLTVAASRRRAASNGTRCRSIVRAIVLACDEGGGPDRVDRSRNRVRAIASMTSIASTPRAACFGGRGDGRGGAGVEVLQTGCFLRVLRVRVEGGRGRGGVAGCVRSAGRGAVVGEPRGGGGGRPGGRPRGGGAAAGRCAANRRAGGCPEADLCR